MRPSNSSGNLTERQYISDDLDTLSTLSPERKGLVKRTKSFWRFGKSSDSEILEGMSLWKHKDLVDIRSATKERSTAKMHNPQKRPSRDRSNDSDKTLNAKHYEDTDQETIKRTKQKQSFGEKQRNSLPRRKMSRSEILDDDYEKSTIRNNKDQFYEDSGDGLILRTVNRKDILQQYTNDSTGTDSESESEIISDDPYDSILVNDQVQKVRKNGHFPNVAEIGRKLEKLSKSSKYPPSKADNNNNARNHGTIEKNGNVQERNERNKHRNLDVEIENDNIMNYESKRYSFKTFGIEPQVNENGKLENNDEGSYVQNRNTNKRRNFKEDGNERKNLNQERKQRQSYDSLDSEIDNVEKRAAQNHSRHNSEAEKTEKSKYYSSRIRETNDEFSESESRQFLPRTKLTKTNSNNSTSQHEQNDSVVGYDENAKRKQKSNEYNANFDNKRQGNMYGPWYDLWGLDTSIRK